MSKEDLYSIMDWWEKIPPDFVDVQTLIEKRRILVTIYVRMGKYQSDNMKELVTLHAQRRLLEAKGLVERLDQVDKTTDKYKTLGRSSAEALIAMEDTYKRYYTTQGLVDGIKVQLDTVEKALTAMNQEISRLNKILNSNEYTQADNRY